MSKNDKNSHVCYANQMHCPKFSRCCLWPTTGVDAQPNQVQSSLNELLNRTANIYFKAVSQGFNFSHSLPLIQQSETSQSMPASTTLLTEAIT
jgi:hypothetical protein